MRTMEDEDPRDFLTLEVVRLNGTRQEGQEVCDTAGCGYPADVRVVETDTGMVRWLCGWCAEELGPVGRIR